MARITSSRSPHPRQVCCSHAPTLAPRSFGDSDVDEERADCGSYTGLTAQPQSDPRPAQNAPPAEASGAFFASRQAQKSQSSSSVLTALPMTYDEPDPEKKSWFSSAFGERADRIAGFTSVMFFGNIGSYPRFMSALFAL